MPACTDISPARAARPARRPWWHRPSVRWGSAALVLVATGVLLALHFAEFEWRDFPGWLQQVNEPLALVLMATLPIVGFPITAVYLAVGAIFGPLWGGVVVAGITLAHLGGTHLLARTVLRRRVAAWHEAWHRKLPVITQGDNISLAAMIVIVPGLPYVARNCLLAVSGLPLRYVFGVGVPLYVARSYTILVLGNLGNDHSAKMFWILGAIFVAKLTVSGLLFLRLRRKARQ